MRPGVTSVGADPHLENHIDAFIPALVDGRAECGKRSSWRRNEENEVLTAWNQNTNEYKHKPTDTYNIPTYTCIYLGIDTYAIKYLAWRGRLERHGVNGMDATPFLVRNILNTEKLERSVCVRIRHILQPLQGRLEVFSAQLAVCAIGRREAETGYPIRVIIYDKMDKL